MSHVCYACNPDNPDRVVRVENEQTIVNFVDRFEGPPDIANWGFAIGTLACAVAREANGVPYRITGRLNAPVPLREDLTAVVERRSDGQWAATLNAGERELISSTVDLGPAGHETWAELPEDLEAALARMQLHVHDRPTGPTLRQFMDPSGMGMPDDKCFGCGRAVENGGLYLLGRAVAEDTILSDLAGVPEYHDADAQRVLAVLWSSRSYRSPYGPGRSRRCARMRVPDDEVLGTLR